MSEGRSYDWAPPWRIKRTVSLIATRYQGLKLTYNPSKKYPVPIPRRASRTIQIFAQRTNGCIFDGPVAARVEALDSGHTISRPQDVDKEYRMRVLRVQ